MCSGFLIHFITQEEDMLKDGTVDYQVNQKDLIEFGIKKISTVHF